MREAAVVKQEGWTQKGSCTWCRHAPAACQSACSDHGSVGHGGDCGVDPSATVVGNDGGALVVISGQANPRTAMLPANITSGGAAAVRPCPVPGSGGVFGAKEVWRGRPVDRSSVYVAARMSIDWPKSIKHSCSCLWPAAEVEAEAEAGAGPEAGPGSRLKRLPGLAQRRTQLSGLMSACTTWSHVTHMQEHGGWREKSER